MPENSQQGSKTAQALIDDFKPIKTQAALRQWEKLHRDEIKGSDFQTKELFDTKWKAVVGASYFVGITELDIPKLQHQAGGSRIDPAANLYKTERVFNSITWKRAVFTKGKGIEKETFESYEISGIHSEDERFRLIAIRCKPERVTDYLGNDLAKKVLAAKAKEGTIDGLELPIMVEGHWEVQFTAKGSKWDKNDVEIQWEGQCLQMQRSVPIILPGRYIEVNDHARYPFFMKVGDQPRKIVGWVQHFPCTPMREATKKEYDQQKAEGDHITKMARAAEEAI